MSSMVHYPAPDEDVVITSRVRLARNYDDIPFMPKMNEEWAAETLRRVTSSVENAGQAEQYRLYEMKSMEPWARDKLVEHHLISYDLLKHADKSAALISTGDTISIMVNEEDHLRIQGLLPGLQVSRAAELAMNADDMLARSGHFAFDVRWGYLTACPTNTGTGMRASAMLHLPALSMTGQIGAVMQAFSKLGMTVRGLYGEGSAALGNLYQLSNQVTLGRAEEDMIKSLEVATQQIMDHERATRRKQEQKDSVALQDRLMRSLGILREARVLTAKELMRLYSNVRFAAGMGYVDIAPGVLDKMMMDLQSGSLQTHAGRQMTDREMDILRADVMRETLKVIKV